MPRFKGKRVLESSVTSFLILILLCFILYNMFKGFYLNILLGLVLAISLRPLHVHLTRFLWQSKSLGAFASIIFTITVILIPLLFLGQLIAYEAIDISRTTNLNGMGQSLNRVIDEINVLGLETFGTEEVIKKTDVMNFVQSKASEIGYGLLGRISNLFSVIASSIILLMTVYYALVDWERMRDYIYRFSPLTDNATKRLAYRGLSVVRAAIKGHIVMIFVYAAFGGIGFAIFGLRSPLLLGALYGVGSLVPAIGTGIIWIPCVVYLALTGNYVGALLLALWNMLIVGSLDNVIMPALVKRGARLHPFLILIGVLGGLSMFGLVGFIIGPTLIALTMVTIELFKENSSRYKGLDVY